MFNANVERINRILLERYGTTLNGLPFFKVVWSDDELEYRKGTFNEFSGPLFVRQVTGVRRVPKYNYIKERWILEKFVPPPMSLSDELPLSYKGTYEPLYVFETKGAPLEPILLACEFIIFNKLNPKMDSTQVRNYINELAQKANEGEIAYFKEAFDNESNILLHRFHFGEAILNPLEKNHDNKH